MRLSGLDDDDGVGWWSGLHRRVGARGKLIEVDGELMGARALVFWRTDSKES